jgi:hypothetical protein
MQVELAPSAATPQGLAFEIPDLLLAQAFAASCGLRVVVETNHHTDCEEFEEVLALYHAERGACRCLVWRSADDVAVQPMPGRRRRFASLSEALEWVQPEGVVETTDLAPARENFPWHFAGSPAGR